MGELSENVKRKRDKCKKENLLFFTGSAKFYI